MSAITDIECVLSQKAFDVVCEKFHIPEETHPVLPNQGDTMHERPTGKIGLYTRFFDFANFRLSLSTFLVDILRHFRINISQLFLIGAAKISFSKRSDNAPVCYTKPLDSLKNWNNHFFWVDDFACPASFLWHTAKQVTKDPAPVAADFNAQDYATLVAHPSPFWKFPEELLFLTTVGRTVPLLPVAPDRAESELEASVDRLFEEGGSGNQTKHGDSTGGGGQGVNIQPVIKAADAAVGDVAHAQPKRQRKRKIMVVDAGRSSHPPKKLREDHGTPSGPSVAGKSRFVVQRLLAGAVLNTKVRGEPIPTLPFVTSSISATLKREAEDHTDSVTEINLRTISAPQRFVISSDSSQHSGANVTEAEVDSLVRSSVPVMTAVTTTTSTVDLIVVVKEKTAKPSLFAADSSSTGGANPNAGVFSDLTESDFLVSGVRTVIDPDTDLQKVYVPQWSVTNGSRLNDDRICREMVDEFAPLKFFASVRGMEHDQLFTEFNVGAAR
ncbi:hypothetical protein Tco_0032576 [Tanacetum coccineum]